MLIAAGQEPPREEPVSRPTTPADTTVRRVVPQTVVQRQLANPFLAPDFSSAPARPPRPGRLAGWELITPLLRSFEHAGGLGQQVPA